MIPTEDLHKALETSRAATPGEWIVTDHVRGQKLILAEGGATLFGTGLLCNPKNADHVATMNPAFTEKLITELLEARKHLKAAHELLTFYAHDKPKALEWIEQHQKLNIDSQNYQSSVETK